MATFSLTVQSRPPKEAGLNLPAAVNAVGLEDASCSPIFLQLEGGSDYILQARCTPSLVPGTLLLDEAQQHNLRLVPKEQYSFSVFTPPVHESFDLVELEAEVMLMRVLQPPTAAPVQQQPSHPHPHSITSSSSSSSLPGTASGPQVIEVDASELTRTFSNSCHGRILAVNEHVLLGHGNVLLLLRVTAVHSATEEEREDIIGYHCFRARCTPDTAVFLRPAWQAVDGSCSSSSGSQAAAGVAAAQQQLAELQLDESMQTGEDGIPAPAAAAAQHPAAQSRLAALASKAAAGGASNQHLQQLQLVNVLTRSNRPPPTNVVHVTTSDGEWFPVKKKLLRPCIALTQVVRDAGDTAPSVTLDIDTLTFDRALIFMEALALDQPLPDFPLKYLDDLLQAASVLSLRSLTQHCERLTGSRTAALARYSPAQVAQAVAGGAIWLLLDGMVLDVGAWLPQHPGGSTIIPRQALNCDCSRFFEMYHASRESFLYLKEFYIGELHPPEAAAALPQGGGQPPSSEFMAQLREYTAFRKDPRQLQDAGIGVAFKSF